MTAYTTSEIDSIAGWLKEGLTASQIATRLTAARGTPVTRNAIIGVVHRRAALKAIGFANSKGGRSGGRPKKDTANRDVPPAPAKRFVPTPTNAAPNHLPNKLFIAAIEELEGDDDAFQLPKTPTRPHRAPARQAHSAAMRFVDCLVQSRCRAPLSYDLEELPGPDMLCCGFRAVGGRPYCEYHEIRLTARRAEFLAVAA